MFSPKDRSGPPALSELQNLKSELQSLSKNRLVQDHSIASAIQHEFTQIQDNHSQHMAELKADQALRRAERYLELLGEGANRTERDAASLELTKLEKNEEANLVAELQRITKEAEMRDQMHMLSIERQRNLEDQKYHEMLVKLSGSRFTPKHMLGMIVVVDKMITNWPFEDKIERQIDYYDTDYDYIGSSGSPSSVSALGTIARGTVSSFGLTTPDYTPPSSNEPRFPNLQTDETPTRAPLKRLELSAAGSLSALPSPASFGPALVSKSSAAAKLPPSFEFRIGTAYRPAIKAPEKVFIDLTSDFEDDSSVPKFQEFGESSAKVDSNTNSQPSVNLSSVKTPSKRKAKKPPVGALFRSPRTSSIVQDEFQISAESLASVVQEVSKNFFKIKEPAPVEETGPIEDPTLGIFDSDSDYSETESRKRRRFTSAAPQGPHRNRTGALTMSELIEHPAADLSFAKGTTFKVWSRRLYLPRKLMKFSVKFIRAVKDNGEISRFNDDLSPVGFYFLRKAHTFVPVIGHNRKEDVHPEWVLEEDEVLHAQYNHEHALVCFTKTVGMYRDVLVKFSTREDMWNLVAVASMEMEMVVYQK